MGGDAYNEHYVSAQQIQADSNESVAETQAKADLQTAKVQSDAVIRQAELDKEARIYEADKNYEIQMKALEVREKEAKWQYEVDWKQAQNDAIRAEAALKSADASYLKATAKLTDVQLDHNKEKNLQLGKEEKDYYYGLDYVN